MGLLFEGLMGILLAYGEQKNKPTINNPQPATTDNEKKDHQIAKKVPPARVAPFWQDFAQKQFKSGLYDEGWGIFSYGGWSDAGQVILLKKKGAGTKLIVGKPNSKEVEFERQLTHDEFNKIEPHLQKIPELRDIELTMFDGIVYEFSYLKKPLTENPESDPVQHRVYYKNPGTQQKFHQMDKLVELAESLRSSKK